MAPTQAPSLGGICDAIPAIPAISHSMSIALACPALQMYCTILTSSDNFSSTLLHFYTSTSSDLFPLLFTSNSSHSSHSLYSTHSAYSSSHTYVSHSSYIQLIHTYTSYSSAQTAHSSHRILDGTSRRTLMRRRILGTNLKGKQGE